MWSVVEYSALNPAWFSSIILLKSQYSLSLSFTIEVKSLLTQLSKVIPMRPSDQLSGYSPVSSILLKRPTYCFNSKSRVQMVSGTLVISSI